MTLIAFHAQPHRADIVTDTLSYASNARRLAHTSKLQLLPHLDAALVTQGSTNFGRLWWFRAAGLATQADDFDDFTDRTPDVLRDEWARLAVEVAQENDETLAEATTCNSVAFTVGYSTRARGFVAWQYASDFGFKPAQVDGLRVMPSPLDVRPSELELHRLDAHLRRNFDDVSPLAALRRAPEPKPPATAEQWVALARKVRQDRALVPLHSGFKTYVGGDVVQTTLTVGSARQKKVHTFDDHGAEFTAMMADSLHPVGQLAPCSCDSGGLFVDCCLRELDSQGCPCGSGKTFDHCCSVRADDTSTTVATRPRQPATA